MSGPTDIVERLRANEWNNSNDRDDAIGLAADEIERRRTINAELVEALDVLLRYVDEEAEDGMTQCVETQLARDALAKARGEQA